MAEPSSKVLRALSLLLHASYGDGVSVEAADHWRGAVLDARIEYDALRAELRRVTEKPKPKARGRKA